jgi:protein-tyrosine-phosphatase
LKLKLNADSAGLYKGVFGKTIPKSLREALWELGEYSIPEIRRSQAVTKKHIEWADRVFYMNPVHYKQLQKKFPEHRKKFFPLGGYTEPPVLRVPDLMFLKGSEYTKALKLIETGVKTIARVVK